MYYKKNINLFIFICFFILSFQAHSKINVVTTTNELKWVAQKIGGEEVTVESLLSGHEDPHYIDAVPSYIQKVSRADVVCFVGLDLEVGWLPKVLKRSGNQKVQRGQPGFCETGDEVETIKDHHGDVDRSMGDVHPGGNPHFWLSPNHLAQASQAVLDALILANPELSEKFVENYESFQKELRLIHEEVTEILSGLPEEFKISDYHKEFAYFFESFEIKRGKTLEEVPGSPPSAGRIARVAMAAKNDGTHMALASTNYPERHLERFSEISGLPYLIHPDLMRRTGEFSDYRHLLESLANSILETAGVEKNTKEAK